MRWLIFTLLALPATADPAKVEAVKAAPSGGAWRFEVTLSHGDTGWDDYANGWRVTNETGRVLGTRELLHPHVDEQPFTRSLSGVKIPQGVKRVWIETSTLPEGWGGPRVQVDLP
ncbi:hypothetical protein [Vannielia litorea]|uniref:hypothetical protein n=1 Tax=Vannielia litorea TaxID=1217970 RepID=UPI001C94B743|nr:hypothetical protein [Vannielia litorea]MBY6046118.1 hypothetical protein [Vannielia litorea]MBY6073531.1 hypothetical protein [Vannielia litorea]